MVAAKSKRGRPPLPESRRRHMIGVHVVGDVRDRLDREAKASGRSLSNHVELLIERSFERRALLAEILEGRYGKNISGVLLAGALAMRFARSLASGARSSDGDYLIEGLGALELTDSHVRAEALKALVLIAQHLLPTPMLTPSEGLARFAKQRGKEVASWVADRIIATLETPLEANEGAEYHQIRDLLGDLAPPIVRERLPGGRPGNRKGKP